jgi:hypothetical protein
MKKEIAKGFAMLTLIVAIALATAVVSANAQSSRLVVADIPFDFVVGDQTMPAAEYRVRPALGSGLIIQSADANNSAMRLTSGIESRKNKTQARLVFHRYGNRYFLSEVWTGGRDSGLQLNTSSQERAAAREFAAIARITKSTYETVEVLATLR